MVLFSPSGYEWGMDWTSVYIGLGSNLGDRRAAIVRAVDLLMRIPGVRLREISSMYETAAVGMAESDPAEPFINAVVGLDVTLSPEDLLATLRSIEVAMGRPSNHPKNTSRPIDLDLLLYGQQVIQSPNLHIPHPRMHERRFVMQPLAEIAPDLIHPQLHRSILDLSQSL